VHYLDHPLMGLIIKLTPVDDVSAPPAGGAD